MQLLCPACDAVLPAPALGQAALSCSACASEIDLSRLGTVAGKPRFVPERDRSGAAVGGHRLGARLGAGGMGQVYRADPITTEVAPGAPDPSPVAIKFLSAALAASPDLVLRFAREVALLRTLDHPAIVRVLDSGSEDGVPWFAMTLVEGPSLRTRLGQGPLPLADVRAIFTRVLGALEHAHARGIIHRDLKPANVLLAKDGAVLADFGIAAVARPSGAVSLHTRLTETAAVLGTLPYMSPEQRAGAALDARSDLYSLGVMLYEALTGVLPEGAFAPPSKVRTNVPARVDAVVMRLLRPQRDARFASAAQVTAALSAALRPRRTKVWLAAGAAAAGVFALAGGGALLLREVPTQAKVDVAYTTKARGPVKKTVEFERSASAPAQQAETQGAATAPPKEEAPVDKQGATPPLATKTFSRSFDDDLGKNASNALGKTVGPRAGKPVEKKSRAVRMKSATEKPSRKSLVPPPAL